MQEGPLQVNGLPSGDCSPLAQTGIALSIVIPTHNRAHEVIGTVASLNMQVRGKPAEIIVTDSASSSEHAGRLQVLQSAAGVRLIRLDQPGVSAARNAGVARARGSWLGFLDDDVIPHADWVDVALDRIRSAPVDVAVIAGRVVPRWPQTMAGAGVDPSQVGPRWRMLLSIIEDERVYCSTQAPVGVSANLLIRRSALELAGGFPLSMGRVGASLASGEDPYVMDRIVERGFQSWYDASLVVEHKIHSVRLTRKWVKERARHEGRVDAQKLGSARRRAFKLVKCIASLPVLAALTSVDSSRSEYFIRLQHNLGMIETCIRAIAGSIATAPRGQVR